MAHKLLVLGGTGFIGSEICRIAAEQGHDVVSVSRRGRPEGEAPWMDRVTWVAGNVLDPGTWREHLDGTHAVIHCAGLLREKPERGQTHARLSGDSVEMASWEAEHAGVERFVFLSAQDKPPFLTQRYLDGKRMGEQALRRRTLRHIILRPMFVHGPGRPSSQVLSGVLRALDRVPGLHRQIHPRRPLPVEQVAAVAVAAATDLDYDGVISLDNIEALANDGIQAQRAEAPMRARRLRPAPLLAGGAVAAVAAGVLWGVLHRR